MTAKLIAPASFTSASINGVSGTTYTLASDRTITVDNRDVSGLLLLGFAFYVVQTRRAMVRGTVAADLVSVVNAVTPSNVALTIAAQPSTARKLQVRIVIGTPATTDITAGTLTLVGFDQDGNALTQVIDLARAASATIKTTYAFAKLTSATVAGYAANGSGTGNTIGIGLSNDFGLPTIQGGEAVNFTLLKATKITTTITGAVTGVAVAAADDVAATATVDATARTVAPTTAPSSGLIDFDFTYSFGAAA